MSARERYVVTCVGERERQHEHAGVALSNAITLASRATGAVTAYVRSPADAVVARVERDELGRIVIVSTLGRD